jgi:hypothetical protein
VARIEDVTMPLIKPRTRGKEFVRLITSLEQENFEALHAYAQFIGEPVEYVLNQLVDTVLAKDKEYVAWRATHPQSYVPKPAASKKASAPVVVRPVAVNE